MTLKAAPHSQQHALGDLLSDRDGFHLGVIIDIGFEKEYKYTICWIDIHSHELEELIINDYTSDWVSIFKRCLISNIFLGKFNKRA